MDHYARRVRVAWDAGVISAVARSGLCHQKLARRAALGFLSFQGDAAPVVNAAYYQTYYRTQPRWLFFTRVVINGNFYFSFRYRYVGQTFVSRNSTYLGGKMEQL